jgi:hypothetical protein
MLTPRSPDRQQAGSSTLYARGSLRLACCVWIVAAVLIALALSACADPEPEFVTPLRPTVVVITAVGPYYVDFEDAADWLVGESERSRGAVEDGRYVLSVNEPSIFAWTHQQRTFGDGVYEVDAALTRGPEASAFGFLLLGSSDLRSFAYCMVTGDGRYDVGYCEDGCRKQESLVGGFALAYTILTGNQTNHLRVELNDGHLNFLVNGALVSQVDGLNYSNGLVGLVGESSPYGGFEVAFDNLHVTELSGETE